MQNLKLIGLSLLVSFSLPNSVGACICGFSGGDAEALAEAGAVFVGSRLGSWTVVRYHEGLPFPVQRYTFAVESSWKDPVSPLLPIVTRGSNCDFHFETEGRFLVFLRRTEGGEWEASKCLPTRELGLISPPDILGAPLQTYDVSQSRKTWWEPLLRPLRAGVVFLYLSRFAPISARAYNERWFDRVPAIALWVSVLVLAAGLVLSVPRRRRKVGIRLLAASAVCLGVTLLLAVEYLRRDPWFDYLLH